METPELTSADYWESDAIDLRLNPRRRIGAEGLLEYLRDECGVRGAVVLATSGSSGGFKFVVLSKRALLASARAVNEHCGFRADDVSLAGLSEFHVGGLGIHARAFLSGSRVVGLQPGPWRRDGSLLVESIEETGATLTSMTPTHLHDLVVHEVPCPATMRCVLLGGGRIDPSLAVGAAELGWPVRASYGMTEAASQVATARDESVDWLPVLPTWETRLGEEGRLAIRGDALFSGYVRGEEGNWRFELAVDEEGWFLTGDRCEIRDGILRFVGRADDLVKISGELVSVSELETVVSALARELGGDAALVARPDPRRETELVLVVEREVGDIEAFRERFNESRDGIERLPRVIGVERLPRTEIGKLDRNALLQLAGETATGSR